ncbi:hypothetical protein [Chromobacterium sp. CV08]|uniref:hypothetical protein n=1 Tax=Chromobacterium sp. CV08 TaxID=3133274 RepID=UPI003DA9F29F
MKRLVAVLSLLLAGGACASGPAPSEPALAGHYYLQGVREVGGELLLKPDGSFEWGLSYGAVDQYAQGRWTLRQGKVELDAAGPDKEPAFRPFRDEEMRVRRPAEPGHWIAIVGMPGVGPMQGVEVSFVSRSGKTASAVTDANGDASVEMPETERWTRAGLRRTGAAPQQWFDVAGDRADRRLAAFAVDDAAYLARAPFRTMTLTPDGDGGLATDDDGGRMVYRRR